MRVRERVGRDGERVVAFHYDVTKDPGQKMADRLVAARWLSDRGFGRVALVADAPDAAGWPSIPAERTRTPERFFELLEIAAELGWSASPREKEPEPGGNFAYATGLPEGCWFESNPGSS
jgi:hypothetical protein